MNILPIDSIDSRPILVVTENFPECPKCGVRLVQSIDPIGHDEDGPIYKGVCEKHGEWRIQEAEEEDNEEEES